MKAEPMPGDSFPDHLPAILPLDLRRRFPVLSYCRACGHNSLLHFEPARRPWSCGMCECPALAHPILDAYVEEWLAKRSLRYRPAIPIAIRRAVLARDGMMCRYCGRRVHQRQRGPGRVHFDHVQPWSAVRRHDVDNIVVSCRNCNLSKGTSLLRPRPLAIPV